MALPARASGVVAASHTNGPHLIRCIVVGDDNSGRTLLLHTTANGEFVGHHKAPTLTRFDNLDDVILEVDNTSLSFALWDGAALPTSCQLDWTAVFKPTGRGSPGEERQVFGFWTSTPRQDLSQAPATTVVLLYSILVPEQMTRIQSHWMPLIRKHAPTAQLLLVGHHVRCGGGASAPYAFVSEPARFTAPCTKEASVALAADIGAQDYMECDSVSLYQVKEVFTQAMRLAMTASRSRRKLAGSGKSVGKLNLNQLQYDGVSPVKIPNHRSNSSSTSSSTTDATTTSYLPAVSALSPRSIRRAAGWSDSATKLLERTMLAKYAQMELTARIVASDAPTYPFASSKSTPSSASGPFSGSSSFASSSSLPSFKPGLFLPPPPPVYVSSTSSVSSSDSSNSSSSSTSTTQPFSTTSLLLVTSGVDVNSVGSWSTSDVVAWLTRGVEWGSSGEGSQAVVVGYASMMQANAIDGGMLLELTDDDLTQLGISNQFHRRRLKREITKLVAHNNRLHQSSVSERDRDQSSGSVLDSVPSVTARSTSSSSSSSESGLILTADSSHPHSALHNDISFLSSEITFIRYSELESITVLTEGFFGRTYLARWPKTKQRVVIKVSKARPGADEWAELKTFLQIPKHPHVLAFLGLCPDFRFSHGTSFGFVTEFMEHGSVHDMLQQQAEQGLPAPSPSHFLSMAMDMVSGLAHLHAHGILHRDIAARNMLVSRTNRIVVADFGLSRTVDHTDTGSYYRVDHQFTLPVRWLAPESILDRKFTRQSDVWMTGVTFWQLLTSCVTAPYQDTLPYDTTVARIGFDLQNGKLQLKCPLSTPDPITTLIQSCLALDPVQRPTMAGLHQRLSELLLEFRANTVTAPTGGSGGDIEVTPNAMVVLTGSIDVTLDDSSFSLSSSSDSVPLSPSSLAPAIAPLVRTSSTTTASVMVDISSVAAQTSSHDHSHQHGWSSRDATAVPAPSFMAIAEAVAVTNSTTKNVPIMVPTKHDYIDSPVLSSKNLYQKYVGSNDAPTNRSNSLVGIAGRGVGSSVAASVISTEPWQHSDPLASFHLPDQIPALSHRESSVALDYASVSGIGGDAGAAGPTNNVTTVQQHIPELATMSTTVPSTPVALAARNTPHPHIAKPLALGPISGTTGLFPGETVYDWEHSH